jgi:protein-tyrosine phosphatase
MYKFSPASIQETIVYGAARPDYGTQQVNDWIHFMQHHHIKRVCCLLSNSQIRLYRSSLLAHYQQAFSHQNLCWAPIEDFCLVERDMLFQKILPFISQANQQQQKVVVHCAGGIGRTGQVLAAWLVAQRDFSAQAAIKAVKQSGRNPHEAVIAAPLRGRNPLAAYSELNRLLAACRQV